MTTTTAVLRLKVEGGREVTSEVRGAAADLVRAQKDIEKASVEAAARIEAAQKAAADRTRARRRKDQAEVVQETRESVGQQGAAYRQGAVVVERTEQLVTRAKLRELALQDQAQRTFIERYKAAHVQATAAFEAEVGKRGQLSERERRQVESVALAIVHQHELAEKRRTADSAREANQRVARERAAAAEARRAWASVGGQVGSHAAQAGIQAVTMAHGEIQNAREVVGDRTSALNTSLGQRGTSEADNARDNARIQARVAQARTGVAPEVALRAIANAQSFAGALNGGDRHLRDLAIDATLEDVEFAGAIDPQNVAGITNMGALLRRQVHDPALRRRILRGAVGTSFEGSVETDAMITSALPGLLEAISTGTANAGSDAERERLTAEISQDFFAQVQSQAAGGRATGVSAHRTNTVRRALGNDPRQGRLGLALAEVARTGTPEQRAAFEAAFTKDRATGEYSMNEAVRSTPSNAARFLGTMFNNDNEALHNFMGVHGGGGARQLMNTPDVDAIGSYFGMTTNRAGQAIREYDHVDELKTATVTDEQAEVLRRTRAGETRTQLIQERERALANWNPDNQGLAGRASNRARTWMSENPILSVLGLGAASTGLTTGAGMLGKAAFGGLRAMVGGGGLASALLGLTVAGTGLGLASSMETARTGRDAEGREVSTGSRLGHVAAQLGSSVVFFGPVISALRDLPRQLAEALRDNPPVVRNDGTGDVHGQTTGAGNGGR